MKLEGTWYNELKSKMVLKVDGAAVTGSYETAVGETFGPCALSGRAETASKGSQSVAFVVCWQNDKATAHCCTAWSGQLQVDKAGKESLVTTWLLTEDTSPGDDWNSTKVGQDIFYRDPPTTAPKLAELRRAPSHPLKST
jgi:hypothetical protein